MAIPWGPIIGAAGSLFGGLLGKSSAEKQAAQQREYQENQLQYMVRDAKKAGISPLAALGQADYARPLPSQGNPLGEGIANAGRSLSSITGKLGVERAGLENDLLRAQIQQIKSPSPIPGQSAPRAATMAQNSNNQEVMDLYVKFRDPRNGRTGWMVNPELGDTEQLGMAAALEIAQGMQPGVNDPAYNAPRPRKPPVRKGDRLNSRSKNFDRAFGHFK